MEGTSQPQPGQAEAETPWRGDGDRGVGRMTLGLMVIWLGAVLMLRGWLSPWWAYMLSGFGVVFLIEALLRMSRPELGGGAAGRAVAGIILILIGSVFISGFADWWALALVVLGLIFFVQGVRHLRRAGSSG